MQHTSFASAEYGGKKRRTRRERFLMEVNSVVPWARLEALIEPHYAKGDKVAASRVRPPFSNQHNALLELAARHKLISDSLELAWEV